MQGSTRMRVALMLLVAVGAALPASAQLIPRPASVSLGVNYTADISNSPPGSCGCFAMQGGGVNVRLGLTDRFSAAADFSVVNTGTVPGANYGLGLMTLMAGPAVQASPWKVHTLWTGFAGCGARIQLSISRKFQQLGVGVYLCGGRGRRNGHAEVLSAAD